ncbi:MAG: hypothetical protein IJK36_03035, partial [Bacteroidales bacterium]|nr:hypothetical protein [Bacteroidales bacterium]
DVVPNLFRGDKRAVGLVGNAAFFWMELHIYVVLLLMNLVNRPSDLDSDKICNRFVLKSDSLQA